MKYLEQEKVIWIMLFPQYKYYRKRLAFHGRDLEVWTFLSAKSIESVSRWPSLQFLTARLTLGYWCGITGAEWSLLHNHLKTIYFTWTEMHIFNLTNFSKYTHSVFILAETLSRTKTQTANYKRQNCQRQRLLGKREIHLDPVKENRIWRSDLRFNYSVT